MSIEVTIAKINRELICAFAELDSWFDHPENLLYEKFSERWSAAEILEHVKLTNHFLLILIEKGGRKARTLALQDNWKDALKDYNFENEALEEVARPDAFVWDRPEHMVPVGQQPLREIRQQLREQLYRCLVQLELLGDGEGVLVKTTMTVNQLGKLDVYQYIYFLTLHAKRHCRQLINTVRSPAVDWLI